MGETVPILKEMKSERSSGSTGPSTAVLVICRRGGWGARPVGENLRSKALLTVNGWKGTSCSLVTSVQIVLLESS